MDTAAKMRQAMESKLAEEINNLNFSVSEIMECSSCGIVSAEVALAMRDHIDEKSSRLEKMYDALSKADRICRPPVTGPMARKTRGPVEELTDADKSMIAEAYKRYYPDGCPT